MNGRVTALTGHGIVTASRKQWKRDIRFRPPPPHRDPHPHPHPPDVSRTPVMPTKTSRRAAVAASTPDTAPAAPAGKRDRTHYLYIAVIAAVALGIAVGLIWPS